MAENLVNKQLFAFNLGFVIMLFHITFTFLVWFILEFPDDRVTIKQISLPVTTGYAVGILKYYLDTKGIVSSQELVGVRLVWLVSIVVGVFCMSLVGAPLAYLRIPSITAENLNSFFLVVESGFGALIALIFSFLYGSKVSQQTDSALSN